MKKLIVIGMPRSGTSWLGQIINSSPDVLFRTEPLFAYRFKNKLNPQSSDEAFRTFFDELIDVDDEFILQKDKLQEGYYPEFEKSSNAVLAFKTTRHFELLERYLNTIDDLHIVAIIRHPCAVINSWFNSYREFEKKGCNQQTDWKNGGCRKHEVGEYWGFDDWLMSTKLFQQLAEQYPNFHLIRYVDLVEHTQTATQQLFQQTGLAYTTQTEQFLTACHQHHDDDPYSVFKTKDVVNSWEATLNPDIRDAIIQLTHQQQLTHFLD